MQCLHYKNIVAVIILTATTSLMGPPPRIIYQLGKKLIQTGIHSKHRINRCLTLEETITYYIRSLPGRQNTLAYFQNLTHQAPSIISHQDSVTGNTLLHLAAHNLNFPGAQALLQSGACPLKTNNNDKTTIQIATEQFDRFPIETTAMVAMLEAHVEDL